MTGLFKALGEAIGLVRETVQDPDLANRIIAKIQAAQEETYRLELQTKTVPWVDALHKMGRQILSLITLGTGAVLLHLHPDMDPLALASIIAPGGVYNWVKGRGR